MRHDTTPEEACTFLSVSFETLVRSRGRSAVFGFANTPVAIQIATAISRPLALERPTRALRAV